MPPGGGRRGVDGFEAVAFVRDQPRPSLSTRIMGRKWHSRPGFARVRSTGNDARHESDTCSREPAILRCSTTSRCRLRAQARRGAGQGRHHRRQPARTAGAPRRLSLDAAAAGYPRHRDGRHGGRAGRGREPLRRRPEGLCHGARTAGPRRLLRRIHRGAGAGAVRAAGGGRSGGGGVPVELSGGVASHCTPRRAARRAGACWSARRPAGSAAPRCNWRSSPG